MLYIIYFCYITLKNTGTCSFVTVKVRIFYHLQMTMYSWGKYNSQYNKRHLSLYRTQSGYLNVPHFCCGITPGKRQSITKVKPLFKQIYFLIAKPIRTTLQIRERSCTCINNVRVVLNERRFALYFQNHFCHETNFALWHLPSVATWRPNWSTKNMCFHVA